MVRIAQDLEKIGVGPTCETVNIHLCWCHVGALQMCVICVSLRVWPIAPSQTIIIARARDVFPTHGEESSKPSPIHRATAPCVGQEFAWVAEQLRLHLAHFLEHVPEIRMLLSQLQKHLLGRLMLQCALQKHAMTRNTCTAGVRFDR